MNIELTNIELEEIMNNISDTRIKFLFKTIFIDGKGYDELAKKAKVPSKYLRDMFEPMIIERKNKKKKELENKKDISFSKGNGLESIYDLFEGYEKWEVNIALIILKNNKPEYREIIDLKYGLNEQKRNYSYEEIVEIKKLPYNTIANHLYNARKELLVIMNKNRMDYNNNSSTTLMDVVRIELLNIGEQNTLRLIEFINIYSKEDREVLYMYFGLNNDKRFYKKEEIFKYFPKRNQNDILSIIDRFAIYISSVFIEECLYEHKSLKNPIK